MNAILAGVIGRIQNRFQNLGGLPPGSVYVSIDEWEHLYSELARRGVTPLGRLPANDARQRLNAQTWDTIAVLVRAAGGHVIVEKERAAAMIEEREGLRWAVAYLLEAYDCHRIEIAPENLERLRSLVA